MFRLTRLVVFASVVVALLVPSAAHAATYRVISTAGKVAGTVTPYSSISADMKDPNGRSVGGVSQMDGYWIVSSPSWGGGLFYEIESSGKDWVVIGHASTGDPVGRARLSGNKWVLAKRVSGRWVSRGRVTSAVKGAFAVGSLRILLWK
jgi:hypothetical protein